MIAQHRTIRLSHTTSSPLIPSTPAQRQRFRVSLYGVEIRRVICSTNAIESLNARRAIKARGHFPSEQAAMKCLYLVTRSLDPTGVGRARLVRWKPALNAFAITFGDRFPAAETY
jgi:transposase-like protein